MKDYDLSEVRGKFKSRSINKKSFVRSLILDTSSVAGPQGMVPQATPPTSSQVAPAAAVSSLATVHAMPQATKRSQGDSSTFSPVLARAILLGK